jgi:hypothetical protein
LLFDKKTLDARVKASGLNIAHVVYKFAFWVTHHERVSGSRG